MPVRYGNVKLGIPYCLRGPSCNGYQVYWCKVGSIAAGWVGASRKGKVQRICIVTDIVYEIHSGIANGRVLTVEFYTYINQKLLILHIYINFWFLCAGMDIWALKQLLVHLPIFIKCSILLTCLRAIIGTPDTCANIFVCSRVWTTHGRVAHLWIIHTGL